MDLREYFSNSSETESSLATECSTDTQQSLCDDSIPGPSKRLCTERNRKYSKTWEKSFPWLCYDDEDIDGAFCSVCQKWARPSVRKSLEGAWVDKPFTNWKKAIEKMKFHSGSALHQKCSQIASQATQTAAYGSVAYQLQQIDERQRIKNREAIKALLRCAHFLACHHI